MACVAWAGLCLLAIGIGPAHAQETWAPVIMFDGVSKTVNGVTTPILNVNDPLLAIDPIFSGWDYATFGNAPFLFPNGFTENPVTNEWIVADTYHGRLLRFANDHHPVHETGAFLGELPTSIAGNPTFPYGPIVDDQGAIVFADINATAVKAFVPSISGGYDLYAVTSFTDPLSSTTVAFASPYRVAFVPDPGGVDIAAGVGALVVLDAGANKVYKLSVTGGVSAPAWSLLLSFGESAEDCACAGPGIFNFPTGLAVDSAGNIFVSDPQNTTEVTIQVFDEFGAHRQSISEGLSTPWSLTIGPDDRLFITDTGYNRIAVFTKFDATNPSGSLVPVTAKIGSASQPLGGVFLPDGPNPPSVEPGVLQEPTSLAFDQFDRLLVADTDNARMQIFEKLRLSLTASASPQTVTSAQTFVDVQVTLTVPDGEPDGESALDNVMPTVPSVSFSQAGVAGTPVVNTTPSCITTPLSTPLVPCQPLTGFSLAPGQQLSFTFRFDRIPAVVGPVWFSVDGSGLDDSSSIVSSATAETFAVAIDGIPASQVPVVSADFDDANPLPPSQWFSTTPVLVNLTASMPNPVGQDVQQIEYSFGATAPQEGDFYVCFNRASNPPPHSPSCVLPIYKGGVTLLWYRAWSSRGVYDHLTTAGVPGWTSFEIDVDFSAPIFNYSSNATGKRGWFNQRPVTLNLKVADTESFLNEVDFSATGDFTPGISTNVTSGEPFGNASLTFSSEGVGVVTLIATDLAGNETKEPLLIRIDATPPVLNPIPVITSATPLVDIAGATWSRSPITATFEATDDRSGFDDPPPLDPDDLLSSPPPTLTASCVTTVATGTGQSATCVIEDWAGNQTSRPAGPFSIDPDPPTVDFELPPGGVQVGPTLWYAAAAAPGSIDFHFDDGAGSGFATGPTDTVTATVVGQMATATRSDLVGNVTNATVGPLAVDGAAPTIAILPAPPDATSAGVWWYRGPLEVRFDAADNGGSGFAGGVQHVQEKPVSNGEVVSRTYTDLVGNSATASAGPFNMDFVGPTVVISYLRLDGTPFSPPSIGGAPAFNGPFKVRFTATDAGVGFSHPTIQLTTFHIFTVNSPAAVSTTFTDLLGHQTSATAGPFVFETTPPTFTFSTSPAGVVVGSTRWYQTSPSTVTFIGDDGPTGTGFAGGVQTSTVTVSVAGNQASTLFTDQVGNSTLATTGPFTLDPNAPTVTVAPDAPNAMVGPTPWYRQPVSVLFSANDNGGSGFMPGTSTQTAQTTAVSNGAAVSASFTDVVGNSASASAGPFNIDTAGPVVTTAITYLGGSPATGVMIGGITWFKSAVNVTFTATDAGAGFSSDSPQPAQTHPTLVSGGSQLASHTFTDVLGNFTNASAGPFAIDAVPPVLTTANIVVGADTPAANPTAALVSYSVTATDNVDPSPAIVCSPVSGSSFAFGVTTVSCTATDAVGNPSMRSFTVTVEDRTKPVLTVPAGISQIVSVPTIVNYAVTISDNLDPHPVVLCTPASGSVFPLGSTNVSCTAADASGNSITKTFTVTLASTPPTVFVPASFSVQATGPGGAMATYVASATDVIDGPLPVSCTPPSGSTFPLGTTTVTCTATNSGLLSTTRTFRITVIDTLPPVLTAPNVTAVATSPTGATVNFTVAVQDIVDGTSVPVTCSRTSGSVFSIGTTPVTCQATDSHTNTGTVAFNVTVLNSAPVCTAAAASPGSLWPPNHKFVTIGINGITNADGAPVALTIASIYQDEPTNGLGDGDTPIDGQGVGTGTAKVRSERSGTGNGRVYHVNFNATTAGGTCSGGVTVGVPHDQGNGPAVDDGPLHDSTQSPPTAQNDSANTKSGTAVVINVLANDSDPKGYALTVTGVSTPNKGTAVIVANKITYTPPSTFVGTATFTYTISNGHSGLATATVTVTVKKK